MILTWPVARERTYPFVYQDQTISEVRCPLFNSLSCGSFLSKWANKMKLTNTPVFNHAPTLIHMLMRNLNSGLFVMSCSFYKLSRERVFEDWTNFAKVIRKFGDNDCKTLPILPVCSEVFIRRAFYAFWSIRCNPHSVPWSVRDLLEIYRVRIMAR